MKIMLKVLLVVLGLVVFSSFAYAGETALPAINQADTVWVLISTALVMLMIPGLALFYGGMVRRKNVLATLMQCLIALCIISLQWILWGYSLAFGPDKNGLIGGLEWVGLSGVGLEPSTVYAVTVPHQAFMIFQGMFAAITPALIFGAFAERMKFSSLLVFTLLWATLVYDPVCHWVWGANGALSRLGCLDFAGGIVVHLTSGMAALFAALMLGKRKGYLHQPMPPHNLPMTILGTALLWFGWFGFNAGSSLSSGSLAVSAFVATNTAAVTAALIWAILEWKYRGSPTVLGTATGAVAGLATVTPASGFISPLSAIAIGFAAGIICYLAVTWLKPRLGYDDSLDVFGVHGMGGIFGTLAVGLFASTAINPAGRNGLFFGNPAQLGIQALGMGIVIVYTLVVTWIILKVIDSLLGLRVDEKDETMGLDLSQHSESAYTILD